METAVIQNAARSGENVHELALRLRTRRLELLAANIANADTPNYKARDIDFGAELERAMASGNTFAGMTTTSPQHLEARQSTPHEALLYRVPMQSSMDGNTVEMDVERVAFAENAVRMQFSIQKTAGEYKDMLKLYQEMRP
ncbi:MULTISPECIES: flagellar basal body rod protein FlgB [Cupriavidus]|uniref:flagellar basal body rod protein FlgB n=1 Tax=Cupriavidus TaxID=106589 RepID=UPI000CE02950|nr:MULTISPECIES: flagellar basal body rod protein FlgB [Cupriavidus]AVA33705.1 flagellar basal body rod protein FlgB [Cupriavidus metallidurans]KAB0595513.1 flagellar basal body rod protein FlgB [Cupriavidus pauculus]UAL03913.1 flagellar basal body rod protein FlgB [Cupriavidus pauculus]